MFKLLYNCCLFRLLCIWLASFIHIDTEPRDDEIVVRFDERRPIAKHEVKVEKQEEDFFDLIDHLDKYSESKEKGEIERQGR